MTIRKIMALALALIMVCSMSVIVSADEDNTLMPNLGMLLPEGIPADATNVQYLSDLHNPEDPNAPTDVFVALENGEKVVLDKNYNDCLLVWNGEGKRKSVQKGASNLDANGYRQIENGISYHYSEIALGYWGTQYKKGLAVYPNGIGEKDYALVYDVNGLGNHFHAVVGGTDHAVTDPNQTAYFVDFELYGSKDSKYSADGNYELLAHAEDIRIYETAEFNVDITGYRYIKLVVKMDPTSPDNQLSASVWADAALYSMPGDIDDSVVVPPADTADTFTALPIALMVVSGAAVAVIIKKKED